jgi:hypothetical protein
MKARVNGELQIGYKAACCQIEQRDGLDCMIKKFANSSVNWLFQRKIVTI